MPVVGRRIFVRFDWGWEPAADRRIDRSISDRGMGSHRKTVGGVLEFLSKARNGQRVESGIRKWAGLDHTMILYGLNTSPCSLCLAGPTREK